MRTTRSTVHECYQRRRKCAAVTPECSRTQQTYGPEAPFLECFSKKYDDPFNPQEGFAAVMTCSQADESCPIVTGAALRVAIPYEDPKAADGTPEEAQRYDERCEQIATEAFYVFSQINA